MRFAAAADKCENEFPKKNFFKLFNRDEKILKFFTANDDLVVV